MGFYLCFIFKQNGSSTWCIQYGNKTKIYLFNLFINERQFILTLKNLFYKAESMGFPDHFQWFLTGTGDEKFHEDDIIAVLNNEYGFDEKKMDTEQPNEPQNDSQNELMSSMKALTLKSKNDK